MTKNISEENIRVAAYYIWEQAGRPEGAEKECWIKACEQLFAPKAKKTVAKKAPTKVAVKEKKPVAKKEPAKTPVKISAKPVAKVEKKSAKAVKPAAAETPFYGIKK